MTPSPFAQVQLLIEMKQKLAYYFDTDEHEPITPELVEYWMLRQAELEREATKKAVEFLKQEINRGYPIAIMTPTINKIIDQTFPPEKKRE